MKPYIFLLSSAVTTLMLFVLMTGCATIKGATKIEAFERVSKQYKYALMASDFDAAEQAAPPEKKAAPGTYDKIRVVRYEVKNISVSEDKSNIRQEVELAYYRTDTMIQKRLRDQQEWNYNPETKKWMLSTGLPVFK